MEGWREFYGNDGTAGVEGYDFRYHEEASSDPSHDWHIHLSCDRDKVNSMDNMNKLLSVLRGNDMPTGLIGLAKGDSGTEVKGLQNLLRRAGYDPGDSGKYDDRTVNALAACRKAMGSGDPDGSKVSGDGYAQLISAVALAYAKQYAGKQGPPGEKGEEGPAGPPGPALDQEFTVKVI